MNSLLSVASMDRRDRQFLEAEFADLSNLVVTEQDNILPTGMANFVCSVSLDANGVTRLEDQNKVAEDDTNPSSSKESEIRIFNVYSAEPSVATDDIFLSETAALPASDRREIKMSL